ncbi:MAG: DUF354 domain-containing protein [Bacteroidia bacterium]|jgi:predicted glycosyltransferase
MNFLFYFGHPAHYHMFKHSIRALQSEGHQINILIKSKDILEELLKNEGIPYTNILPEGRKDSKFYILLGLLKRIWRISKFVFNHKTNLLIGSEPSLVYVGKLFNIPSLIFVEDDAHVIPYFAKLTFPLATQIVSPITCSLGKWNAKKVGYHGFQKLPYLHPNQFIPNRDKVRHLFKDKERYFIIRTSKLNAHHDFGIGGLNVELVLNIIKILSNYGSIYISAEGNLDEKLLPYELKINLSDIHHILFYADMLISDSQSMSVEAALLGTPSIRFSDFAGEIGVLEELEKKYNLTYGIPTERSDLLIGKINELLKNKDLKEEFQIRRKRLIDEKIDTAAFFTWLIKNYPKSVSVLKGDVDYQFTFK